MSRMKFLLGTVALTATFSLARGATAQTCSQDNDCPQSFVCVDSGVVNTTTPACPPNADCPQPADIAPKPQIVKTCQAKTCVVDTDCGTGMVCFEEKSTVCSGGAAVAPCAPGADCPRIVPSETVCSTTSRHLCAFKWQVPCNADADCGDGFTCHPAEITSCAGGTGVATPAGGGTSSGSNGAGSGTGTSSGSDDKPGTSATPPAGTPAPTMCTTTTSFPGYCQPKVTACTADSECPNSWTCAQQATAIADPGPTRVSGGPAASSDPAAPVPPDSRPAPAAKVCTPPGGLGIRGADSGTKSGDVVSSPSVPGGGTETGAGTGNPQPLPPPSSGATITSGQSVATSNAGCAVYAGHESSHAGGLVLFTLLGLIGARRLRRR